MADKIDIDRKEHAFTVLSRLEEMKKEQHHCDFKVKVGSEVIHAHRNILCSISDYFNAMLSHDTKEKQSGIAEFVDVDFESVQICIDYIYGKEVSVPAAKYEQLIYVAKLMQLNKLCDEIINLLTANLNPKSFFVAKRIADLYGCKELEEKCVKYVEGNFGLISKEDEFGELDRTVIMKIIKSKNVKITEGEKLDALLAWVKYDAERKKHLPKMMKYIVLQEISIQQRRFLLHCDSLISQDLELYKIFSNSVMNDLESQKKEEAEKSGCEGNAFLIFDYSSEHILLYEPESNSLSQMHKMNKYMKQDFFSVVTFHAYVYVFFGTREVFRLAYSDKTALWEKMADMFEDHGNFPPAVVNSNWVYVIAGSSDVVSKCIERYSPDQNIWTRLKDKPQSTADSAILATRNTLYSFGGLVDEEFINSVQAYNPSSRKWTELSPMNEAKKSVAAAAVNDNIFVFGGETLEGHATTVECYDCIENLWTVMKPMIRARSYFQSFLLGEDIYVFGGIFCAASCIEKYSVERDEWTEVEDGNRGLNIWRSTIVKR